jgi:mitofusin
LNRDSLQTTAVFARQEEIDVVVFVASAENHLTLSAKEFLFNASQEKAYLFVVVNKYDHIRNKEKCRKNILEQIKQLSPRTYEDADDLVHFVDSAAALQPYTANPAFDDLESALRSFVLVKRSKSKLQPVTTYLQNILSDVQLLSTANSIVANHELQQARLELSHSRPILEKLRASRETLDESLEAAEEDNISLAVNKTKSILINALDRVGQGSLAVPNSPIQLPSYPGFFGIWEYARDIRKALLVSIDAAVKLAEDEARIITTQGVEQIQALQETYLPEGVERSRKVFVPEAMFSINRRGAKGANRKRYTVVAGGTQGLGIGLTARPELLETTFFDLFDVNHQFMIYFPNSKSSSSSSSPLAWDTQDIDEDEGPSPTALSVFSLGLGALTMVGGQAIGARGLIEAILRLGDLFSSESSKKWVAPVLCVTTLGLGVYLVFELPSTIPRTVGRRVRLQVLRAHRLQYQQTTTPTTYVGGVQLSQRSLAYSHPGFVEGHGERVGKETRKVLKLKAFDIKKRYLAALEERQKEVRVGEELETKAQSAMRWFEGVGKRVEVIKGEIKLEELVA